MRSVAIIALAILSASCDRGDAAPPSVVPAAPLAAGVVARVAGLDVPAEAVAGIAAAQQVDAATARELAIRDALFAAGAIEAGIARAPDVAFAAKAVLARVLLHELQRESEARGDVTDEELAVVTKRHWLEMDRPAAARVVHAVARVDEKADASKHKQASEVAEAIRRSVLAAHLDPAAPPVTDDGGTSDAIVAAFRSAVAAVPSAGLEIVVEELPPMAADARVVAPSGGAMDETFAKAANALTARGEVSPLVATPFGFHVMVLLERQSALTMEVEERRRAVRSEVFVARQRAAEKELLGRLRAPVQVDGAIDSLLATVPVE
jgi:peptidyl-prolyl cis-trans isomerase C